MLDKIFDIQGWMSKKDMFFLSDLVQNADESALIVELGTWKGKSTAMLYTSMRNGQTVVTIDSWMGQSDLLYTTHKEILERDIFLEFLDNMAIIDIVPKWYNSEHAGMYYMRLAADDAATLFDLSSIDRLFIDCDHNMVGHDIDIWYPKMKTDGMICGHDYNWLGVKEQIESRFAIQKIVDDIWVVDLAKI